MYHHQADCNHRNHLWRRTFSLRGGNCSTPGIDKTYIIKHTPRDREDASFMVTASVTANTTVKNSRASRESGLLCSHSHGESIARRSLTQTLHAIPRLIAIIETTYGGELSLFEAEMTALFYIYIYIYIYIYRGNPNRWHAAPRVNLRYIVIYHYTLILHS